MELIEALPDPASRGLEPLSFGTPAVNPTACTWAIAAIAAAGLGAGAAVGWVNCHHHGCVREADDLEVPSGPSGLPVGELLGMRHEAASRRS
ncbi:hypothetical protein PV458_01840 [Streptomyces sp. MN03-5084-2B]|nr:hypothetical protein [Streptomyces sp. MN03-5084-2B]